jgi:hypothetical protein
MFTRIVALVLTLRVPAVAQTEMGSSAWLSGLPTPHDYIQKRASSYDRSGGNADAREIAPGQTLTLLEEARPGLITHIWFTIASPEKYHLKRLVLRAYWDGEATPSIETAVGDFFGLGLGDYALYQSLLCKWLPIMPSMRFSQCPFKRQRV